jgi:hypothetical protein
VGSTPTGGTKKKKRKGKEYVKAHDDFGGCYGSRLGLLVRDYWEEYRKFCYSDVL